MRKLFIVAASLLLLVACKSESDNNAFYMPGEFEPHEAVWLGWEKDDKDVYPIVFAVIKGLQGKVQVKIAADSDSLQASAKRLLSDAGIDTNSIQFFTIPGERYWIRDHGAAFLVNKKGELAVADFGWSLYGYFDWWKLREPEQADSITKWADNAATGNTSKVDSLMGVITKATHIKSELMMEGGALESNGKGVLIQNEQVTLQRNPGWTKEEIEAEYKRVMNIKKVIWMKKGLADDEHIWHLHKGKYLTFGTGGHTDEFVRFADAGTVLLAWVDESEKDAHPLNSINYERMNENLKILEKATDQEGKPFRIIKVPLPAIIEKPEVVKSKSSNSGFGSIQQGIFLPADRPDVGDTVMRVSASSYLNFLVTNGVVLNATYIRHGTTKEKEERVKAIFKEVFPDRQQVWIDALPLNWSGGGIHCSTQQQPKRKK